MRDTETEINSSIEEKPKPKKVAGLGCYGCIFRSGCDHSYACSTRVKNVGRK